MAGADKPGAEVGGRPLIERVAAAAAGAERLIVAGPPRAGLPGAVVVREDPPGAGPVPALAAALPEVRAPWVALLAGDLPFLTAADLAALDAAATGVDGAVLVDAQGREQWLIGLWRTTRLREALGAYRGASLGGLLGPLDPLRVPVADLRGRPAPWLDCDTADDLATARATASENSHATDTLPPSRDRHGDDSRD
ncbi:MAG: NTP transferase domain-containing protein [Streptosporangiales bacterium]|nr:NTP transferase domain-containing protein [Streptosporangiales bacterium]